MKTFRAVCLGLLVTGALVAATVGRDHDALAVHEWGTFTSVADATGQPVFWQPLEAAPDLPCFVNRLSLRNIKGSSAFVRMETPVIYFYAPRAQAVHVRVRFPQGMITEWYPQATSAPPSSPIPQFGTSMEWNVQVDPNADAHFPVAARPSRYYAARDTDAAPLRIGNQQEKLIFYRGIADFSVPLRPRFTSEKLKLTNSGSDVIPVAIVFENRAGKVGWRRLAVFSAALSGEVIADMPALTGNVDTLRGELEEILTAQGLYPKEAHAMLETWRDSWFEEGTRVLYIVPRGMVDSVLPLTVEPTPAALARVFVGRVEVRAPWMAKEIEQAVSADDPQTIAKYGRFLQPFLQGKTGPRVRAFLNAAYGRALAGTGCGAGN